jgi:hypothetical protein
MMATVTSDDRDRAWADAAIRAELQAISRCLADNPYRPDSQWWKSVFRIASVIKGSGRRAYNPTDTLALIEANTPPDLRVKGDREHQIGYLWGRAYNRAAPRYRDE